MDNSVKPRAPSLPPNSVVNSKQHDSSSSRAHWAGQGPVSLTSLGLCSHPVDWGRQHLGLPKQSLWKHGFGSAGGGGGGGATGAEPCLHPDQNALENTRPGKTMGSTPLAAAGLEESSKGGGQQARRQASGQNVTSGKANHSRRNGPSPEGPLTSTRRPILAMCGEQSLTVSSFSICKRQKHSSKSDRARCSRRHRRRCEPAFPGGGPQHRS